MLQLLDTNHRICHSALDAESRKYFFLKQKEKSLDPQSSWGWQLLWIPAFAGMTTSILLRERIYIFASWESIFYYTYKKLAWILDKGFRGWQRLWILSQAENDKKRRMDSRFRGNDNLDPPERAYLYFCLVRIYFLLYL